MNELLRAEQLEKQVLFPGPLVQRQGNEWTLLRVPFGLFLESLDRFRLGRPLGPQALMGAHESSVLWQDLNQDIAH